MQKLLDSNARYYLLRCLTSLILFLTIISPSTSRASYSEEEWLALNIFHEARGESLTGMAAVAIVTLNRVEDSGYPNTIEGVVTQNKQFSWYDTKEHRPSSERNMYEFCLVVSKSFIALWNNIKFKSSIDNSKLGKIKWYHNKEVSPDWSNNKEYVMSIGNHKFYSN